MSFEIYKLVVGQMAVNCYLVVDAITKETLIIDPGDSASYIIAKLQDLEAFPIGVVVTHGHFDHTLGSLEICMAYDIPFYMHSLDTHLLKRQSQTSKYFTGLRSDPAPEVNSYLDNLKVLNFGKSRLKVVHLAGHTPGSISLYSDASKIIFVGDLLFADGQIGRSDFKYSDKLKLQESISFLKKKFAGYLAYPGHGRRFTIETIN